MSTQSYPNLPLYIDKNKDKNSSSATATADPSEKQMEEKLLVIWNYYLDAFNKEEPFSRPKKKVGMAVLSKLLPDADHVRVASQVIDMAAHILKTQPQKTYMSEWWTIFKWSMFRSLYEQYRETEYVPAAANLPEPEAVPNV